MLGLLIKVVALRQFRTLGLQLTTILILHRTGVGGCVPATSASSLPWPSCLDLLVHVVIDV